VIGSIGVFDAPRINSPFSEFCCCFTHDFEPRLNPLGKIGYNVMMVEIEDDKVIEL